jgi:hypothetical protein
MRILISKLNTEIHRTINAKLRKELDALLNEFAPSHVVPIHFNCQSIAWRRESNTIGACHFTVPQALCQILC